MTQNSKQNTQNARSGSVVAFDLGTSQIRVIEAELSGGEARIVKKASVNLTPNLWNQLDIKRDSLTSSIREALSQAGISSRSAVACLPRNLVTVRFARLPHAAPEQLRGMIEFEAQQYILFPLEEVILDYKVVDDSSGSSLVVGDELQTVLLVAAKKTLVSEIVSAFDRAGATLEKLSVSSLALAENIRDVIEPTALVSVDQSSVDVVVTANQQLLFSRSSLVDVLGVDREVGARKLSEEITRSFTAYQNEFRNKSLSRILLCGAATTRPENDWVEAALTDALEMPVTRLQTRTIVADDTELRGFAAAAGVALQTASGNIAGVNLVPNDRAIKKATQKKQSLQGLLLVGALGLVGLGGWYLFQNSSAIADLQKKTLDANREMTAALKHQAEVKKVYDKSDALESVIKTGLDREHPSVDILVALNQAMPKASKIWLTQLGFERGGILSIRGEAKDPSTVTGFLVNLQKGGAFHDVRLYSLGDAEERGNLPVATAANSTKQDALKTGNDANSISNATPPTGGITPLPGMSGMNGAPANPGGAPNPNMANAGGAPPGMSPPPGMQLPPGIQFPPGMSPPPVMQPPPGMQPPRGMQVRSGGAPPNMGNSMTRVSIGKRRGPILSEVKTNSTSTRIASNAPPKQDGMPALAQKGTLTKFVINCRIKKDGALIADVTALPDSENGPAKSAKKLISQGDRLNSESKKDETGNKNANSQ